MSGQAERIAQEPNLDTVCMEYMAICTALSVEDPDSPLEAIDTLIERLPPQYALRFLSDLIDSIDTMHAQINVIDFETQVSSLTAPQSIKNYQKKEWLLGRLLRYGALQKKTIQRCQVAVQQLEADYAQLTNEKKRAIAILKGIQPISDAMQQWGNKHAETLGRVKDKEEPLA